MMGSTQSMPWKDRETRNAYQRAYRRALGMQPRVLRVREWSACLGCGEPLGPRAFKYCSPLCQRETRHRLYIERWLAGEEKGGSVAFVSKHVRRYLVELGGDQCSRCGWAERHPRTGKIPLDIDHINGNYADNRPENVRLLCPNCHALTLTYKGMNRGNGRPYAIVRRQMR